MLTGIIIILGIFEYLENCVKSEAKIKASDWLNSITQKSISKTIVESPHLFIEVFDKVFGKKHLTMDCFFKSCMVSIIAVVFMTIIWILSDFTSFIAFFD